MHEAGVICLAIGQIRIVQILMGNRRTKHNARRSLATVVLLFGIIDPLLVTKTALKNAVSVVSTIISADCVISNMRMNESN